MISTLTSIYYIFPSMFALLPSDLFIEDKRFKFHVCRVCGKGYIN